MVGRKGVWFGRRTILARTNVQAHSLPWPDDVGITTGYLCFVESSWLRSFGLVWFVRGSGGDDVRRPVWRYGYCLPFSMKAIKETFFSTQP